MLSVKAPSVKPFAAGAVTCVQKELDIHSDGYIIVFTTDVRSAENQTFVPAPAGHAESSTRSSAAREFSGQRVLRSARPGAGKVRDAPAGGSRQATGQSGRKDVWSLTSVVLSSTDRIPGNWSCRTLATQAWATFRTSPTNELMQFVAQLQVAEPGISSPQLAERIAQRFAISVHPRSIDRQLRHQKTSVSAQPTADPFTDRRLVAAYEELRSQAVQGRRQGPGLALMITRGFRCWMES